MFARMFEAAAKGTSLVAVVALTGLVGVTVVDVTGRYLFNKPLFGAVEISEFLLVFLSFGGLALAELRNGHITVDFFTTMLPLRVRAVLDVAGAVLGFGFWAIVAWRALDHAQDVREAGEVSLNLGISTFPFYAFVALGSVLLAVMLVGRIARALRTASG
jgi:TRAP-type transport system small permease protein